MRAGSLARLPLRRGLTSSPPGRLAISLLVLAAFTARAADAPDAGSPVPLGPPGAKLLPPLSDSPPDGKLDPDLAAAVAEARARLDQGDLAGATHSLMALLSSNDRFTHSQRAGLAGLAAPVLHDAGKAQAAQAHWPEAAQAFDAAWVASGKKRDPDYAAALIEWAKARRAASPKEALWLARRARLADPESAAAAALDNDWSSNGLRWPAWISIGFGLGAVVTGFTTWQVGDQAGKYINMNPLLPRAELDRRLSTMHTMGIVSTASNILGAALIVLGLVLVYVGQPVGPPISPESLPALEAR